MTDRRFDVNPGGGGAALARCPQPYPPWPVVQGANAATLAGQADIDGFLVGGASLKPEVRAREESHARLRRLDRECIASLPCTPLRCSLQRSCGRLLALSRRSRAMSESRLRMQEP